MVCLGRHQEPHPKAIDQVLHSSQLMELPLHGGIGCKQLLLSRAKAFQQLLLVLLDEPYGLG